MITTYGSGTTIIPSSMDPTGVTADIVSYQPSTVNGIGYQDHNRSGTRLIAATLAAGASISVEAPNLQSNIRGLLLDIHALYDGVLSTSGVQIYTLYSLNNGSTYSSSELVATISGRVIDTRLYVEYRNAPITNIRFTFTNTDTTYPCKGLNIKASPYR